MAKDHGRSVKDDEQYEALRKQGESKEKAARIANASSNEGRSKVGERGGKSGSYEDWSVDELQDRAAEIGIEGRSGMDKKSSSGPFATTDRCSDRRPARAATLTPCACYSSTTSTRSFTTWPRLLDRWGPSPSCCATTSPSGILIRRRPTRS